jgi:phospholipase C
LTDSCAGAKPGGMRIALALLLATAATPVFAQTPPDCRFGPGALPADTIPASALHGDAIPLDHIVVIMQENRSFDHYFGHLRKKSGPPKGSANPDPLGGAPIAPFHQKAYCEVADLDHSWNGTHHEWDGGAMDGFTAANVDPKDPSGTRTMGYYTAKDLPYYYKLYRTFAMADRYFCSLLSQTFPNRYYLLAATSFGQIQNLFPDFSGPGYTQRTIFNLLDEASPPVSWKVYYSDLPFAGIFGYVRLNRVANLVQMDPDDSKNQFLLDAAAGTLPQVSYIDPSFVGETENDEHPPTNIQKGQAFVAKVIGAVLANKELWKRTAIILTYDEHGGYWDHVPPPPACAPDDIPPMLNKGDAPGIFDRYGIRVPAVVISPYARKHFVSHRIYDHTSILRFIESRFDLPALTRRDANADPLSDLFDFKKVSFKKPPHLPKAKIQPGHDECPS